MAASSRFSYAAARSKRFKERATVDHRCFRQSKRNRENNFTFPASTVDPEIRQASTSPLMQAMQVALVPATSTFSYTTAKGNLATSRLGAQRM